MEVLGAGEIKGASQGLDAADPADLGDPWPGATRLAGCLPIPAPGGRLLAAWPSPSRATPRRRCWWRRWRPAERCSRGGQSLIVPATRFAATPRIPGPHPARGALWSASVAGRPVRPGRSSDGVLLPLTKSRVGEEAPAFSVEWSTSKGAAWPTRAAGGWAFRPPTCPPTARDRYHSPRYKLTAQPGRSGSPLEPPASAAFVTPEPWTKQRRCRGGPR